MPHANYTLGVSTVGRKVRYKEVGMCYGGRAMCNNTSKEVFSYMNRDKIGF